MQINSRLRPLHEVGPWGAAGQRRLHGFGLTDGWYWLDLDGTALFRCDDAYLAQHPMVPGTLDCPYADDYVARLWEDLLDLLPAILSPVPPREDTTESAGKTACSEPELLCGW